MNRLLHITEFFLFPILIFGQQIDFDDLAIRHLSKLNGHLQKSNSEFSYRGSGGHLDRKTKLYHAYTQQYYYGIEIFNAITTTTLDRFGNIVHHSDRSYRSFNDSISDYDWMRPGQFVQLAAGHLDHHYKADAILTKKTGNEHVYRSASFSHDNIIVKKVLVVRASAVIPCWQVTVNAKDLNEWWEIRLDARSGKYVEKNSWTLHCDFGLEHKEMGTSTPDLKQYSYIAPTDSNNYNVVAFPTKHPLDGGRTIINNPAADNIVASPYGWHDVNAMLGAEYTITRGNNVHAYEDISSSNFPGLSPDGGDSLNFNFDLDLALSPEAYLDASITNLFYVNNVIHDVMYNYGFDEAAGNFQQNNYGNGGSATDYVRAEALDGSGLNNANFATPPDGTAPRMQMFGWQPAGIGTSVDVTFQGGKTVSFIASRSSFALTSGVHNGEIVYANPNEACSGPLSNAAAINGKIALIDRGNCTFVAKGLEAQNAGAIGAIIVNNVGSAPVTMGGSSSAITIPLVMIGMVDGQIIKDSLTNGVMGQLNFIDNIVNRDSDLDNGIIIHEYGHGISNRLTGGPITTSCLSNAEQMGEGWSDWFSTLMTIDTGDIGITPIGVGTYVLGQPNNGTGIRPTPYSTDMSVNPATYEDIETLSQPHGVGYVWASMLWDMTWLLIEEHGFDPDLYNGDKGNNIALQLVMDGLKMQPCNPGFADGRDAILAADQLINSGEHQCLIWEAFSRRGLGYSAQQNSSLSRTDGLEAYDMPPSCSGALSIKTNQDKQIVQDGDTINIDFVIHNFDQDLTNSVMASPLNEYFSYIDNSGIGQLSNDSFFILNSSLDVGVSIFDTLSLTISADTNSQLKFYESVDHGRNDWVLDSPLGSNQWSIIDSMMNNSTKFFFIPDSTTNNTQIITSDTVHLPNNPILGFYHYYNTETEWDGGFVELSTNGSDWESLDNLFMQNGYSTTLRNGTNDDIDNQPAFSGNSGSFVQSWIDLSTYANEQILIRFVFGSDFSVGGIGWAIDDIAIYDVLELTNKSCLTNDQQIMACDSLTFILLPPCSPCFDCMADSLTISSIASTFYPAQYFIDSDALVDTSGHKVIYQANQSIELKPNFQVNAGTEFQTIIDNCNNN